MKAVLYAVPFKSLNKKEITKMLNLNIFQTQNGILVESTPVI